ncbi:hypothetical protein QBC35DRAFT_209378 [Podospora australis]|uniref:DUF6594 domain-containing protein n=1 Tax=Podospora australis TaxID=1536484 RepID=A0AAN6WXZ4_9PEZI|nr:hypothetical protein QBC35DRAFT_209378 [Podospora australis]
MDFFRTFSAELGLLKLHYGTQCGSIMKEIRAFTREHGKSLRSLPDHRTTSSDSLDSPYAQYDRLMTRLHEALNNHFSVITKTIEIRKLYPLPIERHRTLMQVIENEQLLQHNDAAVYFDRPDDFSTINPLPPHWVTRVLHSAVVQQFLRKRFADGTCRNSAAVSEPELLIINVANLLGTVLFLLVPIGCMMLANLTNGQVYALIVGCTLPFTALLSRVLACDTQKTLIGACGYLAVMAAFTVTSSKT